MYTYSEWERAKITKSRKKTEKPTGKPPVARLNLAGQRLVRPCFPPIQGCFEAKPPFYAPEEWTYIGSVSQFLLWKKGDEYRLTGGNTENFPCILRVGDNLFFGKDGYFLMIELPSLRSVSTNLVYPEERAIYFQNQSSPFILKWDREEIYCLKYYGSSWGVFASSTQSLIFFPIEKQFFYSSDPIEEIVGKGVAMFTGTEAFVLYHAENNQVSTVDQLGKDALMREYYFEDMVRNHWNYDRKKDSISEAPTRNAMEVEDSELPLKKLSTGLVAVVDLETITADTSYIKKRASELRITSIRLGDKDRPPTRFETQKSHTVAWTLLRAGLMSLEGRTIDDFLIWLEAKFKELDPFVREKEGRILADMVYQDGKVGFDLIHEMHNGEFTCDIWKKLCSALLVRYLQVYQLSQVSVYNKKVGGRGEGHAIDILFGWEGICREEWGRDFDETEKKQIKDSMNRLIDVQFRKAGLGVWEYAYAVCEWKEMLELAFPTLMERDKDQGFTSEVLNKKLTKSFYTTSLPMGDTMGDPNVFLWQKTEEPTVRDLVDAYKNARGIDEESASSSKMDVEYPQEETERTVLTTSFLANIILSPVENSMYGWKAFGDNELVINTIELSNLDRAVTKYVTHQGSHTVAWTLTREALLGFQGVSLSVLSLFLMKSFEELREDLPVGTARAEMAEAIRSGERVLSEIHQNKQPLLTMTSYVCDAVRSYVIASQAADSATYYNPLEPTPLGHGESYHMGLLRKKETALEASDSEHTVSEKKDIIEAALGLADIKITDQFSSELARKAYNDLMRKLTLAFPKVIKVYGPEIFDIVEDRLGLKKENDEHQKPTDIIQAAIWI